MESVPNGRRNLIMPSCSSIISKSTELRITLGRLMPLTTKMVKIKA